MKEYKHPITLDLDTGEALARLLSELLKDSELLSNVSISREEIELILHEMEYDYSEK